MTGRPLVGLLAALLVEGRYWVKLRWNFNDASYESAWQITFVMTLLSALIIWLDESRYTAVMVLMGWMPPLLLPLQFVQSYGLRNSVRLTAFSLLARRSRLRNQRLGLIVDPVRFNFGNVTFVATLLAAAVGIDGESRMFLPGVMILTAWLLLGTGRCRWLSLLPVVVLAGLIGLVGQIGIEHLEKLMRSGGGSRGDDFNPNYQATLIGERGRVNLSSEIVWRLRTQDGSRPPLLLRTAAFSNFLSLSWQNQQRRFIELDSRIIGDNTYHLLDEGLDAEDFRRLPSYKVRGSVGERFALPIPGNAAASLSLAGDRVEKNQFGTVRVTPAAPVVDTAVFWGGSSSPEEPPEESESNAVAPADRKVIRRILKELELDRQPTLEAKLAHLDRWFDENFRYTLDLTIRQRSPIARLGNKQPSALEQFLTEVRAGHCEYFATAATLILREAGVPARYAVGFAVMEKDAKRGDYLLRGTHGHAWCRVWNERTGQWVDFDPTPPDWMGAMHHRSSWLQRLKDALKRMREDFYLWRTDPQNETMVVLVIAGVGLSLSVFIIRRLWRTRNRVDAGGLGSSVAVFPRARTPLHGLERLARRHLGRRRPGSPYGRWLADLPQACGPLAELQEALALHQRWRFDPQPISDEDQQRLATLTGQLELQLKQHAAIEHKP